MNSVPSKLEFHFHRNKGNAIMALERIFIRKFILADVLRDSPILTESTFRQLYNRFWRYEAAPATIIVEINSTVCARCFEVI